MRIRAKFRVESVVRETQQHGVYHTIKMRPVTGGKDESDENMRFWKATPDGHLEIQCAKEDVAAAFVPGKEYYLDFTPVSEA